MIRADRGDVERRRARAAASSAETPPSVWASSSKVSSATIGSEETAADGLDRGDELVEVVERLDHEEVDAASLEELRLLGEDGVTILRRAAERADRAGDEDVGAGDLARVARDLHCRLVDRRDVVLEVVLGELAAVRAERVRLDDLRAGPDEPEVEREHALGRAQVRLLGAAQPRDGARDERAHAAVADERRAARQASRNQLTAAFQHLGPSRASAFAAAPALKTLPERADSEGDSRLGLTAISQART